MTDYKLEPDAALPGLAGVRYQNKNHIAVNVSGVNAKPGDFIFWDGTQYRTTPVVGATFIGVAEFTQQDTADGENPTQQSVLVEGTIYVKAPTNWTESSVAQITTGGVLQTSPGGYGVGDTLIALGGKMTTTDFGDLCELLVSVQGGILLTNP